MLNFQTSKTSPAHGIPKAGLQKKQNTFDITLV